MPAVARIAGYFLGNQGEESMMDAYTHLGTMRQRSGTLGVCEWVSGSDTEGVRIAYAAEQQ